MPLTGQRNLHHPVNCAAITPNIHREIHFGKDGTQLNEQSAALIREKEKALESS